MIQDQTGYSQINPDHGELKIFLPALIWTNFLEFCAKLNETKWYFVTCYGISFVSDRHFGSSGVISRSPLKSERNYRLWYVMTFCGHLWRSFLTILTSWKKMNFKLMELLNEYSIFWFRVVYILEPKRIWTVPAQERDFNSRILGNQILFSFK